MGESESINKTNENPEDDSTDHEEHSGSNRKTTVAFDINKSQSNKNKTGKNSGFEAEGEAFRVNKDQ